jgi:hypothetical protein
VGCEGDSCCPRHCIGDGRCTSIVDQQKERLEPPLPFRQIRLLASVSKSSDASENLELSMKATSLMRLCVLFEWVSGMVLIVHPDVCVPHFLNAPLHPADFALARSIGFVSLFLGMVSWPVGADIDPLAVFSQLAFNLLSASYFGYLTFAGSPLDSLPLSACASHSLIAVLIAGLIYEKAVALRCGSGIVGR